MRYKCSACNIHCASVTNCLGLGFVLYEIQFICVRVSFLCLVYFLFVIVGCQYQCIDCLERLVSEMTYYVSSGTLNSTHLLTHLSPRCVAKL